MDAGLLVGKGVTNALPNLRSFSRRFTHKHTHTHTHTHTQTNPPHYGLMNHHIIKYSMVLSSIKYGVMLMPFT